MADVTINISGLQSTKLSVAGIKEDVTKILTDEFNKYGTDVVTAAKRRAPNYEGRLVNAIGFKEKDLEVEITVGVNYAAYVEFGTKKFAAKYVATLPAEWQVFAAQYKGKGSGGSFEEFVMRLTIWVQKRGIGATYNIKTRRRDRVGKQSAQTTAEADAYGIALYIIRNGIRPHPFLVPSVEENKVILIANLKNLFSKK